MASSPPATRSLPIAAVSLGSDRVVEPGHPHPLGAVVDGDGVNFALFSAHATAVVLCLFDAEGVEELERIVLPAYTHEVWHGRVIGLAAGAVYGYRVHGPFDPAAGHRFDPAKLLLDPYTRAHVGALIWSAELFAYPFVGDPLVDPAADADLFLDERDSAPFVPKCVVVAPRPPRAVPVRPRVPWDETVLYEMHVRGFTMRHPDVSPAHRGTFAALADDAVLAHLAALGVTSIELLPVQTYVDDRGLRRLGLTNFWGYNPIAPFAAEPRYFAADSRAGRDAEWDATIDRLHAAGFEVILDVVHNHSGEGDELGTTLSYRGIDNASYYRLRAGDARRYANDAGTGNTFDLSHPRVLQMVMDSLRYWVTDKGVDGFRFDLAPILARDAHGFDAGAAFLHACRQDPVLSSVKLIAEPWDVGADGYRLGDFPPGWAEWNDRFRDTVRGFWRGDASVPDLSTRLAGSADRFRARGRQPWSSVNFVTAHDGFTMHDLVSYDTRHNAANGEDGRDGAADNRSWNCGVEGPTDDGAVVALRQRQQRNFFATLFLARGTPMILAGDEFGRTQVGNNNAYCQDNEVGWVDWSARSDADHAMTAFVARLIALRRSLPFLHDRRWLDGVRDEALGTRDVAWLQPSGDEMDDAAWGDPARRCLGMLVDGRVWHATRPEREGPDVVLALFNANAEAVDFHLPAVPGREGWDVLVDTADPTPGPSHASESEAVRSVVGRSMVLLAARRPAPDRDAVVDDRSVS